MTSASETLYTNFPKDTTQRHMQNEKYNTIPKRSVFLILFTKREKKIKSSGTGILNYSPPTPNYMFNFK